MSIELQLTASLQLLLAMLLSTIIGLERDRHQQPAGLRTHMLVYLGSCLFTIASYHAFSGSDSSRVDAQVVTGIGFLGAGTILHFRQADVADVKHLTTAASIWNTAAIGLVIGTGAWVLAISATLITWFVLDIIRRFESDKINQPIL